MIVNVCFTKGKNQYWWDYFTGKYKHCFLCIMDTKLMIYDFRFDGFYIAEATDDDFIDVEVIQVEVKDLCISGYRPCLTCADFCASMLGIRGFIITPNRLRNKIRRK